LETRSPERVTHLETTLEHVSRVVTPILKRYGVSLLTKYVQRQLTVTVHPSLMRQVLISCAVRLAEHSASGEIALFANMEDGNARITMLTRTEMSTRLEVSEILRGILIDQDIVVDALVDPPRLQVWIEAPSSAAVTVLVVDDNPDMVRFYRSCTRGTHYQIIEARPEEDFVKSIKGKAVNAVVLDVMLPQLDGWQILMQLHEDQATRSIPVVVCSVVQEQALALSLGAARYLAKPILRDDFIQALDQVTGRS